MAGDQDGDAVVHQDVSAGVDAYVAGRDLHVSQLSMSGNARVEELTFIANAGSVVLGSPETGFPQGPPAQLPPDISDFVGRELELGGLRRLVSEGITRGSALVISAIAGRPGVGKSVLARRLAHEMAQRFPDGQLYVDLQGGEPGAGRAAQDVLGSFLRGLGVRESEIPVLLADRAALYRTCLAGKQVLVVLDNAHDEAQVRSLLPGQPGSLVLVTSRRALAIEGSGCLVLGTLSPGEAAEMLGRLAGTSRVAAEPEAAAEVAELCGYLPLALRIVGARLAVRRSWTLTRVAGLLRDERSRLGQLAYGDLDVRASFAVSYRDLSPDEAGLFRLLGIVPSTDFHGELARGLLREGTSSEEAQRLLDALADIMLIEETGSGWYRIHDLIRLFASDQLREQDGAAAAGRARDTMLGWYASKTMHAIASLAPSADADEATRAEALSWLDAEWPTLIVTMEMAARNGRPGYIALAAAALDPFLRFRGAWAGLERMAGASRAYAEVNDDLKLLSAVLPQIAMAQWRQGHLRDAVATSRQAIDAARACSNRKLEIEAHQVLARMHHDLGEQEGCRAALAAAAALAQGSGDHCAEAQTRYLDLAFGMEATMDRDPGRLWADLDALLADARTAGCHDAVANTLISMGTVLHHRGERRDAISRWQEALQIAIDHDLPRVEANARENIGFYHFTAGHKTRAGEHYERALRLYLDLGFHRYASIASLHLAELAKRRNDWDQASRYYLMTAGLFCLLGEETGEGNMRMDCAAALAALGHLNEAEQQLSQSIEIFERIGRSASCQAAREALAWVRARSRRQDMR
jgi:tetratricopeptide (TPR) repeat protein